MAMVVTSTVVLRERLRDAIATVLARPRHVVVAMFVLGLATAPAGRPAVVGAGAIALLALTAAGDAPVAVCAAAAVIAGAAAADARSAALDRPPVRPLLGRHVEFRAY